MTKKEVKLDDMEYGKKYRFLITGMNYAGFEGGVHLFYTDDSDDTIGVYPDEIETVWEVTEVK